MGLAPPLTEALTCGRPLGTTLTSLTLLAVAAVVYGLAGRRGYGMTLGLGGATPVGAALAAGTTALPTFYAATLGAALGLVLRMLYPVKGESAQDRGRVPGLLPLGLLAVWNVLVVLVSPLLFDGTTTLPAPGGALGKTEAGLIVIQNVAQAIYLALGVAVVAFLARAKWAGPEIIGIASGLSMLLSFWAYLGINAGVPFPAGFFDNSPAFIFIDTLPGGAPRFRGIFSEPAGLAAASLVCIAYMTARVRHVSGLRRIGVVVVGGLAAFMASVSTSTTFLVAGVALVVIALGASFVRVVLRRGPLSALSVTVVCLAAIAATYLLPLLAAIVDQAVSDKVSSSSFSERSFADALSLDIVVQTYGLGVGLGSHRPSSFLPAMLSTIGVVGTGLLLYAILTIVRRSLPYPTYRPVVWGLVALLTTKVVSGPDLNDTNGILWLSLGVLAHAAVTGRRGPVRPGPRSVAVEPVDQHGSVGAVDGR